MNYHYSHGFFHGELVSRRALAFSGIAAFHILIAYLLLTALVQPPLTKPPETRGFVLPDPTPQPPAPLRDDFRPSQSIRDIQVPPTDPVVVPQEPVPPAIAAVVADSPHAGTASAVATPAVRIVGVNQLPNSEDYYPPELRREGVQGATNVRVCVNEQGVPQGDPLVEASSGNARLDMGAVNVARHGRYARAVQGSTPVPSCFRFRITFKIAH